MKRFLFFLAVALVLSGSAFAKHKCECGNCGALVQSEYKMKQKGGFVDSSAKNLSVAEVKNLSDGAYVTLVGYLTKQLSDDEYDFTDGKSHITVEIGDKDWRGQQVTPKDKISISGKLDKGFTGVSIDVKSLRLVQ